MANKYQGYDAKTVLAKSFERRRKAGVWIGQIAGSLDCIPPMFLIVPEIKGEQE